MLPLRRLFGIARVLVSSITLPASSYMRMTASFERLRCVRVADCIAGSVRSVIPQPTERQRIGDQIDAAMIFARADFVNVCRPCRCHNRKRNC